MDINHISTQRYAQCGQTWKNPLENTAHFTTSKTRKYKWKVNESMGFSARSSISFSTVHINSDHLPVLFGDEGKSSLSSYLQQNNWLANKTTFFYAKQCSQLKFSNDLKKKNMNLSIQLSGKRLIQSYFLPEAMMTFSRNLIQAQRSLESFQLSLKSSSVEWFVASIRLQSSQHLHCWYVLSWTPD